MKRELVALKLAKALVTDQQKSIERNKPVLLSKTRFESPMTALEEHIIKWAPRDVRLDEQYLNNHTFHMTAEEEMTNIYLGMILKVERKDPINNGITIGVYAQSNLAEFERYNEEVKAHNEEWKNNGSPTDVFDPITGDIHEIQDTYVNQAIPESPYRADPGIPARSHGTLAKRAPEIKRAKIIEVEYRLETIAGGFQLSYVAKDRKKQVVYYNVVEHKDLAYLSRRATQEIYGNHLVTGTSGPLLDGISYLIQGKKLSICNERNIKPEWMEGKTKSFNAELEASQTAVFFIRVATAVLAYAIPIYIFVMWVLVHTWVAMENQNGEGFEVKILGALLVISTSLFIANKLRALDVTLSAKNKFT